MVKFLPNFKLKCDDGFFTFSAFAEFEERCRFGGSGNAQIKIFFNEFKTFPLILASNQALPSFELQN